MEGAGKQTTDPDGRTVVFDAGSHLPPGEASAVAAGPRRPHPRDGGHHREEDPHPGRERFYRQHIDLRRWLRVVVDFNQTPAWVVTAAVQDNDPRSGRRR